MSERQSWIRDLNAHLDRQESSVLSRLGAGWTVDRAVKIDRWSRELSDDVDMKPTDAKVLVQAIKWRLDEEQRQAADPVEAVFRCRVVYEHFRSRTADLSLGVTEPSTSSTCSMAIEIACST